MRYKNKIVLQKSVARIDKLYAAVVRATATFADKGNPHTLRYAAAKKIEEHNSAIIAEKKNLDNIQGYLVEWQPPTHTEIADLSVTIAEATATARRHFKPERDAVELCLNRFYSQYVKTRQRVSE